MNHLGYIIFVGFGGSKRTVRREQFRKEAGLETVNQFAIDN